MESGEKNPKLLNWTNSTTQISCHFLSNSYKIEVVVVSYINVRVTKLCGHMTTSTILCLWLLW